MAAKNIDTLEAGTVEIPESNNVFKKLWAYMGPGMLVAIAYIDPGNFDTDIGAGAQFQYKLLWIMVLVTGMGLFLQFLASKLGVVTGTNLAVACRLSYSKPVTIVLWVLTEVAVIAADIPEVVGSAFALYILFGLPLWIGVLVTGFDTLLFLLIQKLGVRYLEYFITLLIAIISGCFVVEMFMTAPPVTEVLEGFIPTIPDGSVYTGISLMGAVVMSHNLFLHSALVHTRRISNSVKHIREAIKYNLAESSIALAISLFINIAIIIVAGAKFYGVYPDAGLENASQLLTNVFHSKTAGIIFGIALLASGQSSTLTGTYAGQFVMEGFLDLKIAVWKRNMITRSVAIIPSVIVAFIFGESGSDELIVLSQVVLSIQLPFCLIPLVKITNNEKRMGTFRNGLIMRIVGIGLGVMVAAANIYLGFSTVLEDIDLDSTYGRASLAGVIIASIVYFVMLVYLAYLPVDVVNDPSLVLSINGDDESRRLIPDQNGAMASGYGANM
jgi:manganese transport protein